MVQARLDRLSLDIVRSKSCVIPPHSAKAASCQCMDKKISHARVHLDLHIVLFGVLPHTDLVVVVDFIYVPQ